MEKTLALQNPHWAGIQAPALADRHIMRNLTAKADLPHIQILTGVRRAGKSTVFRLLIKQLIESGTNPKAILNINLDAPSYIPLWDNPNALSAIIERAESLTAVKVEYLFLDEIQQLKGWEIYVKAAYDARLFRKIYITGSNSNLLNSQYAAMLAGRYFANEIRPFSLTEILATIGVRNVLEALHNLPKVLTAVGQAVRYGSFPEITLSNATDDIKTELLHSYFDSIVQKDCIIYNAVRDPHLFLRTANYLLLNAGNTFSLTQLGKALGSNENTMRTYLEYLTDSYILSDIRNFSFSQKETRRSAHKCYCIDNGLMQANTQRALPDTGRFLENLVHNELVQKGYTDIAFQLTNRECDFLARRQGALHAFQVCYELTPQNRDRELRGFGALTTQNAATQAHPDTKTIITFSQSETIADIRVVPLWQWAIE